MPSPALPGLSPVATEYLRYHDELEAARDAFVDERGKLLDAIGARLLATANEQGFKAAAGTRDDKAGEFDVSISGQYVKRRSDGGKKRSSGFSVHVGAFSGHTGAQTTIWFHLRLTDSRRNDLGIDELAKRLGPSVETIPQAGFLYFRTSTHAAVTLDMSLLEEDALKLPRLFAVADAWLAQRWP